MFKFTYTPPKNTTSGGKTINRPLGIAGQIIEAGEGNNTFELTAEEAKENLSELLILEQSKKIKYEGVEKLTLVTSEAKNAGDNAFVMVDIVVEPHNLKRTQDARYKELFATKTTPKK